MDKGLLEYLLFIVDQQKGEKPYQFFTGKLKEGSIHLRSKITADGQVYYQLIFEFENIREILDEGTITMDEYSSYINKLQEELVTNHQSALYPAELQLFNSGLTILH